MATNFFNSAFYLKNNPDVAAAVTQGLSTAEEHFNLFGKFEARSPNPFFDSIFYLAQNPDVAAALAGSGLSAFDHFAAYGFNESRGIHPTINLGDYLEANPDVAAAVAAGEANAFDHLLSYGLAETRDLGNGVNLASFANDPIFQAAITNGDLTAAAARVADVTPFIPTFKAPTNWTPPENLPIPINFLPVGGEKLTVPNGVKVPDGMTLPDFFEQAEPPPPNNDDTTTIGKTFHLKDSAETLMGTAKNDKFIANANTLFTDDTINGGAGNDELFISQDAFSSYVAPTLTNIETITNQNFQVGYSPIHVLDLQNATDTVKIKTDFSSVNATHTGKNISAGYQSGSSNHTFEISNVFAQKGLGIGLATLSFTNYDRNGNDTTLNLALSGNKEGSYYKAGAGQGFFDVVNIDIVAKNEGVISLSNNVKEIHVTGVENGNLSFLQREFKNLKLFDASEAKGNITFGGKTKVGTEATLELADDFVIIGGSGINTFDLHTVTGKSGSVTGGNSNDTIIVNFNTTSSKNISLTGGGGADTFKITGDMQSEGHITITDFKVADNDKIDLSALGVSSLEQLTLINNDIVLTNELSNISITLTGGMEGGLHNKSFIFSPLEIG